MKIIINTTNKQENLSITDHRTKINFVTDFIGNYGALSDGQFTFDHDSGVFRCSQETYDWWAKVLADHQKLDERVAELKEEYGSEQVDEIIAGVGGYDLEDLAAAINKELDEKFTALA